MLATIYYSKRRAPRRRDFRDQWEDDVLSYLGVQLFLLSLRLYYNLCVCVCVCVLGGGAVAQWLRCCATNWKVAGSIPDGVIGNFH